MSLINVWQFTFLIVVTILITGCGREKKETKKPYAGSSQPVSVKPEAPKPTVKFQAELFPLNSSLAGITSGNAEMKIDHDQIEIKVKARNTTARISHLQAIFDHTECPKSIHDLNQDLLIDSLEFDEAFGKGLLPLDGDLNGQMLGINLFPWSNSLGHYDYAQSASYSLLMSDLAAPMEANSSWVKLNNAEEFSFENKILVIFGVDEGIYLPPTINSGHGKSPHQYLPIACGQFTRQD